MFNTGNDRTQDKHCQPVPNQGKKGLTKSL